MAHAQPIHLARQAGGPGTRRRWHATGRIVPVVLLALAPLYSLVLTEILGGGFLHPNADLDPTLNATASSANVVNEIFWGALFALAALTAILRRTSISGFLVVLWPLALYLLWAAAMLPWAIDPDIALRRFLLQICIIGSILLPIAMISNARIVHKTMIAVLFLAVLLNLAALPVVHPTPLGYAGLFTQKNALGEAMAIALIVFVCGLDLPGFMTRAMTLIGAPLAMLLLVLSRSKTSLILAAAAPILAVAIALTCRVTKIRPSVVIGAGTLLLAAIVLVAFGGGVRFNTVLNLLFNDTTFTGRTDIWQFAWSQVQSRPLTGYGFNGFWGAGENSAVSFAQSDFLSSILEAHDGYLDVLLETGAIGLAIFGALVLATVKNFDFALASASARGILFLALIAFFLIHNVQESSIFRRFENAWVFYLIAMFSVVDWRLRHRRSPIPRRAARHWRPGPYAIQT